MGVGKRDSARVAPSRLMRSMMMKNDVEMALTELTMNGAMGDTEQSVTCVVSAVCKFRTNAPSTSVASFFTIQLRSHHSVE